MGYNMIDDADAFRECQPSLDSAGMLTNGLPNALVVSLQSEYAQEVPTSTGMVTSPPSARLL